MAVPSLRFESLRAFRYPAYLRLWTGAFVSNIGGWVQSISIGVYATETTGKAAWTGAMAAMAYLPSVVLGPLGGALADRVDRRRYLAALTLLQVGIAAALSTLAFLDQLPLGLMAGLVFLNGCAAALGSPAFNALLSEIVAPEDLLSALSLTAGQFNLARAVGPMLAALVLTAGGIKLSFLVNSVSYLAVVLALLWSAPATPPRDRPLRSVWRGIAEGFSIARRDPGIRLALLLVLALAVLVAPFIGLMPAYAIKVFGLGSAAASVMVTPQGLGALAAALFANAVAERWGPRRFLTRSLLGVAPLAALYWLSPWYALAFGLLAPLGGIYLWTLSSLSTTCMVRVSRDLQARMNSLYSLTLSGGYAIGLFLQGSLADVFGLRVVPPIAAGLLFLIALALWQGGRFAAVDGPSEFGGVVRRGQATVEAAARS